MENRFIWYSTHWKGYAEDGIMKTTEEAFDKIAQAVE
jgi:hypothetical protein